jgi:hypothetical protein
VTCHAAYSCFEPYFFSNGVLSHHGLLIVTTDIGRAEGTNSDIVIHYDRCDVDLLYPDNDS